MLKIVKKKDDDLRVRHVAEVLEHKAEEIDVIQLEQDEAIAELFEQIIETLTDENGDPVVIMTESEVEAICNRRIDRAVANKVNTAIRRAKTELMSEILAELNGNNAQDAEDEPEDNEETPEDNDNELNDGEPQDEDTPEEENNNEEVESNE